MLKAITLLAIVSNGLLFTAQKSEDMPESTLEHLEDACKGLVRSVQAAGNNNLIRPSQEKLNRLTIEEINKRIKEIQENSKSLLRGAAFIRTMYYPDESQKTIKSMIMDAENVSQIFTQAEEMYKMRLTVLEKDKVDHAK